jgi:hypothetical protein
VSCTTANPQKYMFLKQYILWSIIMRSNLYDYIWCPFEVLSVLKYQLQWFSLSKILNSPFGRFRKITKPIMNSVMSVCPSVHPSARLSAYFNQLGPHWTRLTEIFRLRYLHRSVHRNHLCLLTLSMKPYVTFWYLTKFFLSREKFRKILFSIE